MHVNFFFFSKVKQPGLLNVIRQYPYGLKWPIDKLLLKQVPK